LIASKDAFLPILLYKSKTTHIQKAVPMWKQSVLPDVQKGAKCEKCGHPLKRCKTVFAFIAKGSSNNKKIGNPQGVGYSRNRFLCRKCGSKMWI